jgi:hypothetical protein
LGGRLDFGSHKPPETINEGWAPFEKELRLSSFFVFLQQNWATKRHICILGFHCVAKILKIDLKILYFTSSL